MEQQAEFQGRMLRVARQARMMTQKQLADAVGISQPFISLIEDGDRNPSSEQRDAFVRALGFPLGFFQQVDPIIGPGVGEIYHRRRKMSPKDLESYYAWANIKTISARKMIRAVDWPDVILPSLSLNIDVDTEEEAARLLRAKWHVARGPVASVSELLDTAGVLVIPELTDHPEMDGMSIWLTDLPPLIFVNRRMPQDRLRFTLMHEVGHLVLHQRSVLRDVSVDIEHEAHRFASAFLMPADEIKPQLRNLTLSKLADLKRHWRVAMSALVMRAKDLEVISPAAAKELWRDISKRGWIKREPEQLDVRGEAPGQLYAELVDLHLNDLGYGMRRFKDFVHLEQEDLHTRILPPTDSPALRVVG